MTFGALNGVDRATTNATNTSTSCATGFSVSVGDLIFVVIGTTNASLASISCSDGLSNSFTALAGYTSSAPKMYAFYSIATNAGTSKPSVSYTSVPGTKSLDAAGFSGAFAASPLDKNPAGVLDTTSPYASSATGTLSQANELVISYFADNNVSAGPTYSATSPNTLADSVTQGSGATGASAGIGYQVVASTASITPAWTSSGTHNFGISVATFKQASAAALIVAPGLRTILRM